MTPAAAAPTSAPRRWPIFLVAAGAFVACVLAPWHASAEVRLATAIVLATLTMWIGEIASPGLVALWVPIVATGGGLLRWDEAVAAWGDPIVFLFLGAFLLARALDKYGVFEPLLRDRGAPGAAREASAARLTIFVLVLAGAISVVQNNTAVTAMLLAPVIALARRTALPACVLLGLSYGATFGGMATPVGTAPNFIGYAAMRRIDESVSFVTWLRVGVPVWLGATVIGWIVLSALRRVPTLATASRANGGAGWLSSPVVTDVGPARALPTHVPSDDVDARRRGRAWAIGAMCATACVWLTCGALLGLLSPDDARHAWIRRYLPESLIPIAAAWVLLLVRIGPRGRTVLDRHDFQALDWDTLFLIAGGLCLGRVLEQSGSAAALAEAVARLDLPPLAVMLAIGGATVLLSELTSNTATATLMVPIAASLAAATGLAPASAIWLVALAASLGFALPVSTPPNALVYGTGLVPLRTMVVAGVTTDVLALLWLVACVAWFA